MTLIEKYNNYINFVRAKNTKELRALNQAGFNPSVEELEQLIAIDDQLKQELFNKTITIVLDINSVAGHLYIKELPTYKDKKDEELFTLKDEGFYPANKKRKLYGAGELRSENVSDETQTKDKEKAHQRLESVVQLTEEQWEHLGHWMAEIKKAPENLRYSLFADFTTKEHVYYCAKFVDTALKQIGYVNGVGGVFSAEQIVSINEQKCALIFFSLPATEKTMLERSKLDANYQDLGSCDNLTAQQVELIKQQLAAGDKAFVRYAIEKLFDKANQLSEKDEAEQLPPAPPHMVDAAFEGFKLAYELQNRFNAVINEPLQEVPSDAEIYSRASSFMAYNQSLLDRAFEIGSMYNAQRAQQEQTEQSFSSSSPKPNC